MGVYSNKYITTTVDIIRTTITMDIMRTAFTGMGIGVIIEMSFQVSAATDPLDGAIFRGMIPQGVAPQLCLA
jgi:hypothetical protein